jgi:Flp pilus assembly protein TadB
MTQDETELRATAERRAQERIALRMHLFAFVVINAGLAAIDWFSDGRFDWFWWPLLGWGIGLAMHMVSTWYRLSDAHDRAVEQEMARLRRRQGR